MPTLIKFSLIQSHAELRDDVAQPLVKDGGMKDRRGQGGGEGRKGEGRRGDQRKRICQSAKSVLWPALSSPFGCQLLASSGSASYLAAVVLGLQVPAATTSSLQGL